MVGKRLGNYSLKREIGHGGMGVVYEAWHEHIGRRAAIKILRPVYAQDQELGARFLNEARAASAIEHPSVVSAFDFGHTDDGAPYIAMDFLAGDTLRQRLCQLRTLGGKLDHGKALRIAQQLASALTAAHGKQIIHRDIKPENIMLVPDPEDKGEERAKILDFGIAKVAFEQPDAMKVETQHNASLGTPTYMAPEQWQAAASVTERADVYSLGVVMYELLVGQPPFVAAQAQKLMKLHLLDAPTPLRKKDPAIAAELSQLVDAMLAKLPESRPTMAAVAEKLEHLRGENKSSTASTLSASTVATETGRQTPAVAAATPDPVPVPVAIPAQTPTPASGRRWLPLFLIGIGVGTLFGAFGASMWWHRHTAKATNPQSQEAVKRASPWRRATSPTTENLYAVWGAGPRDIWAVGGEGQVLHYQGDSWQRVAVPSKSADSLRAIWGSGPRDVWAVGKAGVVMHYDGTRFSEVSSGTSENLYCIYGLSADSFWTGGRGGVLLHWDGKELLPMDVAPPTKQHVRGVWASAANDLYAVATSDANDGSILHWDGRAWTQKEEAARLNHIWGSGPQDVWVAGGRLGNQGVVHHFDGKTWSAVELSSSQWLQSIWGSGPDDVFLAGESNTLFHYNGKLWTRSDCDTSESFRGLWGAGAMDVWAVGTRGVLCHYSGREWAAETSGVKQNLQSVWQSSTGNSWAVGKGGLILRRYAGQTTNTWTSVPAPIKGIALHAVFGTADDAVFIAGEQGTLLRWDGKTFHKIDVGTDATLHALWADRADNIFVAGQRGTLLQISGTTVKKLPLDSTANLLAIFGFSSSQVFAVGEGGMLVRFDGNTVSVEKSGTQATLRGIYGAAANELWAIGDAGTLLRGDGKSWQAVPALTPEPIHAIVGSGAHDIWAVAGGGVTLHYSGAGWTKVLSGSTMALYGLYVDSRGEAISVGQWGTILRY